MSNRFVQRGGWWVVGQLLLLLVIAGLGIGCRGTTTLHGGIFLGAAFLAIAAVCGAFGALALGRNLTPFPKPTASARLVQHGIYALIRHPLYTAVVCAAVGWSLVWQSWLALAASLLLPIFLDAKARYEERWLRRQFPHYGDYARSVKRFIPWLY